MCQLVLGTWFPPICIPVSHLGQAGILAKGHSPDTKKGMQMQ